MPLSAESALEATRRYIQDGAVGDGDPFNMVRLEDLTDQLPTPAPATPTQVTFMVRFLGVLGEQVTVYVVPGTLTAFLDGSPAPVAPTSDADRNGNFTLPAPPQERLVVSYGWQVLDDPTIAGCVEQAVGWLNVGAIDTVPDGLAPALISRSACNALRAMARKCAMADQSAGESKSDLSKLADRYQKLAQDACSDATAQREAFYNPPVESDPQAVIQSLGIRRYEPWT